MMVPPVCNSKLLNIYHSYDPLSKQPKFVFFLTSKVNQNTSNFSADKTF